MGKIRNDLNDNKIVELYNSGKSSIEIAEHFDTTKQTILRRLKINGIKRRSYVDFKEITKEVLIELYLNKRLSQKEIADKFGCGKTLIYNRLKKYKIETRSPSDFSVEERKEKYGKQMEEHNLWKGGITPLRNYLRKNLEQWKKDSLIKYKFKCVITGKKSEVIHHLHNFNNIVDETLEKLNLPIHNEINKYSDEELLIMGKTCLKLHYNYPLGVPLTNDIHNLFHSIYGKYSNTPEQFDEFKRRYHNGEFDQYIKQAK